MKASIRADFIDEQGLAELCRKAWTAAQPEMREPCNFFSPGQAMLSVVKNNLFAFFGSQDKIEGVCCRDGELLEGAYMRRIAEVLADRMNPPFDFASVIRLYIRSAEEQYGKQHRPKPSGAPKPRSNGKRLPKTPAR